MSEPNATQQQTPGNGAAPPAAAAPPAPAEPTFDELAAKIFKPEAPEAPAAPANDNAGGKPADETTQTQQAPEQQPDPRVSSRIAVAKRAELRAAESRRELAQLQSQLDTQKRELEAREAKVRLIEEDPVRAFEEFKIDPKAFLEKLAGEQKPESVIAKRVAQLEEDLKKERALREQVEKETTHRQQTAAADTAWREASTAFIDHVGKTADKYPHLVAEFTEQQAVETAYQELAEVVGYEQTRDGKRVPITRAEAYRREFGDYPDNDVIADHLNALAKTRAEARENSAWRKRNGQTNATASQASTPGEKPAQTVRGSNPRTLTSREASERGTAPKPWSQEAADEESIRIISQSLGRTS